MKGGDDVRKGLERIRLLDFVQTQPYLVARVEVHPERLDAGEETEALRRAVVELFGRLVRLSAELPDEMSTAAESLTDARQVASKAQLAVHGALDDDDVQDGNRRRFDQRRQARDERAEHDDRQQQFPFRAPSRQHRLTRMESQTRDAAR